MRTAITQTIPIQQQFKQQLLSWSQSFDEIVFLDSNDHRNAYSNYDCVLAVDAFTSLKTDYACAFDLLGQYQKTTKDWLFGYLSYDLKNGVEALQSGNFDGLDFPDLFFFQPKKIFLLKGNQLEMQYLSMCDDEMQHDLNVISGFQIPNPEPGAEKLDIQQRIPKHEYLAKVAEMLSHIHRGDIYEANFCMEFFVENARIDPRDKFEKLNAISQPPFAVFFKNQAHFLLSASPERYLKKSGAQLLSQPIKGTAPRFADAVKDAESRMNLASDPKERSENIMITDLVRNDLSRTAQKGAVAVAELCGIHSFLQVHQMITTITSELKPECTAIDAIQTTFPMGSMTGAPKISAMQIIEKLEETKRGLYSGAVGYFTAAGDFDFNVVIRSILYNESKKYVSFSVGSAITSLSDPEKEYEECLLKARAMREVLGSQS